MNFTDRMRESLGHDGPRVHVSSPPDPAPPGSVVRCSARVASGRRGVTMTGLRLTLIESRRTWRDDDGNPIAHQGPSRPDRDDAHPSWERLVVAERDIAHDRELAPDDCVELELELEVPATCALSSPERSHLLNLQALVAGQIDPATNVGVQLV